MLDSFELLEWPSLFHTLLSHCWTPYGMSRWEDNPFLKSISQINQRQAEIDALKSLIVRYGEPLANQDISDIRGSLRRVSKGGQLQTEDLGKILTCLTQGDLILSHFQKAYTKESQPACLAHLLDAIERPESVIHYLESKVTPSGELLETASPDFFKLRQRWKAQKNSVYQRLQSYLHDPNYTLALQDQLITERDGRYVLPVKVEHKSTIPGVVHAGSSSGSTLYLEPQAVVSMNNELQTTQAQLQQEIQKILKEASAYLATEGELLNAFIERLAQLDQLLAAARLSQALKANLITVVEQPGHLHLKQARHPLLVVQGKEVVANDVTLGQDDIRTLVITGPNTGGKTVLLKMVGLFALMIQAGLHLPSAEGSSMSLFNPVLVDIGDQQSLSQDLSTFSAHLAKLKYFVADDTDLNRALVLIDEIAAGTDPAEGSALARAVLSELYDKGATTLVTTHLGELKVTAHEHSGYQNASVLFNPETLSPTYRLMIGIPGTSNAITIAQKLGLKSGVIEKARNALANPVKESAELIEALEQKSRKLEEELQQAESYRLETQATYEKLAWERQQHQEEKRRALQQFKTSLKGRIYELEAQVKSLRKMAQRGEVAELLNSAGQLKQIGQQADQVFQHAENSLASTDEGLQLEELQIGEEVKSKRLNVQGPILEKLSGSQEVVVQVGNLRMNLPLDDILKIRGSQARKKSRPKASIQRTPTINHEKTIASECDVRGMRVEEALEMITRFLDQSLLNGHETVAIIHGQGTGALKNSLRQFLRTFPQVKSYAAAEPQYGGDGKTVINLA